MNMQFSPGTIDSIDTDPIIKSIYDEFTSEIENIDGVFGYKLPSLGIIQSNVPSFILNTKKHGIILIDIVSTKIKAIEDDGEYWITEDDEELFSRDFYLDEYKREIENRLKKDKNIYDRKTDKLKIKITQILYFYSNTQSEIEKLFTGDEELSSKYCTKENHEICDLIALIEHTNNFNTDQNIYDISLSLFEGTSSYNDQRIKVRNLETMNDFILESSKRTFLLDKTQRQVSLHLPAGPQRIRGLAGTGKTIILGMKAALAHLNNPSLKILFVFNTKSMINTIKSYIEKYYVNEAKQLPNYENIDVLHAWGGKDQPGLYSKICKQYGLSTKTFGDVRGKSDALGYIYSELLKHKNSFEETYDLVLIDEAQDLAHSVFEVIYYLTKKPKRIVWAYDEFQTLTDLKMKEPEELFGINKNGIPNITSDDLKGTYSKYIEKDFILSNSYRNPRKTLMLAHSLALGIYRKEGLIDLIDNKRSWEAIGYNLISSKNPELLSEDNEIVIERPNSNSKNILENLLKENHSTKELLKFKKFDNFDEEAKYVSSQIKKIIDEEKIEPSNIFVITLDTRNSQEHLSHIRSILIRDNIRCIMPGFQSEDGVNFRVQNRVTLTTAFKAKGNEASIVFVINSQEAISDPKFRKRNALFVSITRSLGWCTITGNGIHMNKLENEYKTTLDNYPHFKISVNNIDSIKSRRKILSIDEDELEDAEEKIDNLLANHEDLLLETLSQNPEFLKALKDRIK
ncbi:ATP-binding domain-containing protein [Aliarcobacter butzleri]|uniref:DEAD/DEAH box helicase n=1 Tax=Aliarcobacter butzleri TaxID=28197 RepID=UPI0021B15F82|nr:ATP-binding domain-containing protein [Aliarcobacter butzleri]MCT7604556.1 ATP-binding domain-containing protein [Aliarcobacter butzleri]